jgi:hypothetical protein
VNYSVTADVTGSNRTGTLTVAGGTVNLSSGGSAGTITVTATAGCPWTATSSATAWLMITNGAAGTGNRDVFRDRGNVRPIGNPDDRGSGRHGRAGRGTRRAVQCRILTTP